MPPKATKQVKTEVVEVDEAQIRQGPKMPWTEIQSSNATQGRTNHYATFKEGKLLLMGGWSGKVQSSCKAAAAANSVGIAVTAATPVPVSPKSSPTAARAGSRSPIPAGRTPVSNNLTAPLNNHSAATQPTNPSGHLVEVSQYDFGSNSWSQAITEGAPHAGRSQFAVVELESSLVFFAGWSGSARVNDVTQFDLETNTWSEFPPPSTGGGDKSPALTFHTASLANKRCYLFGGNTAEGQSAEMHYLDLATRVWSHAASLGAPGKRSSHSASIVNDTIIVIFGGRGGLDGSQALNDVALFDSTNNHWMIGVKVEGAPPPRYGHTAVALRNKIIVYGGVGDQGQLLGDCWVLEMEKPTLLVWSRIQQEGKGPSPRAGHFAMETIGTTMYVVGGRVEAQSASSVTGVKTASDIFALDLGAIAPAPTTAGSMDGDDSEATTNL